jgi:predicted PurR-regulated permease PerM
LLKSLIGDRLSGADKSVGNIASQAGGYAATVFGAVWSGGRALFSAFSLLVVAPVVTFYLLADWPRMVGTVDRFLPREHYATLRDLIRQMNEAIAGFVRGQTLLCVFLGLFYAVALTVVGLKFGLIIGLVTGVLSFIPYVGSLTGLLLALGAAFAQFWPDWIWIAVVLGIFLVGQFIEGNVLGPKLVGESVGLHPLWLMLALFAFGYLFGFVGLLLAVPLAAVAGVLVRFALRQYLASPLYTGEPR